MDEEEEVSKLLWSRRGWVPKPCLQLFGVCGL